jgi:hypothetical protein
MHFDNKYSTVDVIRPDTSDLLSVLAKYGIKITCLKNKVKNIFLLSYYSSTVTQKHMNSKKFKNTALIVTNLPTCRASGMVAAERMCSLMIWKVACIFTGTNQCQYCVTGDS